MTMKTFCDKCNRDITDDDRFHIILHGRRNDIIKGRYGDLDLCAQCASSFNISKMLEEHGGEKQ